jgi:hypothetical protein
MGVLGGAEAWACRMSLFTQVICKPEAAMHLGLIA